MKQNQFQVTGTVKTAPKSMPAKRGFNRWYRITGLALMLVLIRPSDAWAYVDPATGSYLLQILLAGILAAAFAMRMFWQNLKRYWARLFGGEAQAKSEPEEPKE